MALLRRRALTSLIFRIKFFLLFRAKSDSSMEALMTPPTQPAATIAVAMVRA
jgi:hypothetical protein